MKDSGSERPGFELDDLVDYKEDTFSKLSDTDHCIPLEDLTVSILFLYDTFIEKSIQESESPMMWPTEIIQMKD